jgi:hypothetical protein
LETEFSHQWNKYNSEQLGTSIGTFNSTSRPLLSHHAHLGIRFVAQKAAATNASLVFNLLSGVERDQTTDLSAIDLADLCYHYLSTPSSAVIPALPLLELHVCITSSDSARSTRVLLPV